MATTAVVAGRVKAGREPNEKDVAMLSWEPPEKTYHTLLVSKVFGERSHQLAAEPFNFAIRLLWADVPFPDSK